MAGPGNFLTAVGAKALIRRVGGGGLQSRGWGVQSYCEKLPKNCGEIAIP